MNERLTLRASIEVTLTPAEAFDSLVGELSTALGMRGMRLRPGAGGSVKEGDFEVGRILAWEPGKRIALEWRQATWKLDEKTRVELNFEPSANGTVVTLAHDDWGALVGDSGGELLGWFASEVAAPVLKATGPAKFGDWVIDRMARKPTGPKAREVYRDPIYHRPNFLAILEALPLSKDDYLLEVGCGGGAFLQSALRSGCRAAAIDHSPEMVKVALENNREAVEAHRLEVREGDATALPFTDGTFTCAVMTGVFCFLEDPVKALSEIRRVLQRGGRLVVFTGSKELRGTPAAPEPGASRIHFYEDAELEAFARSAGLGGVRVERPDFLQFARDSGVPEDSLPLFSGRNGQLLLAKKP